MNALPMKAAVRTYGERALVFAVVACCIALAMMLTGCGGGDTPSSSESDSAADESQPNTMVALLVSDRESSAVSELSQQYASEHDEVAFDIQSAAKSGTLRSQLADNAKAVRAASSAESGSSAASSTSDAETESDSAEDADASKPVAAVVGMSASDVKKAVADKDLDETTHTDLVQDSLVVVSGKARSLTMQEALSGTYRLCVEKAGTELGDLQAQTLVNLGARTLAGRYTGGLAGKDKVKTYNSTASLFAAVAKNKDSVAIVLRSDVYRYGGVKIAGEVPAGAYRAPVYSFATTTYATDEQVKTATDFLNWSLTDADALRIWKKWGFAPAA